MNARNLCVFSSDGVFGNHNVPDRCAALPIVTTDTSDDPPHKPVLDSMFVLFRCYAGLFNFDWLWCQSHELMR